MKKYLMIVALSFSYFFAHAQSTVDFESNTLGWGTFGSAVNTSFANPSKTGLNTSNTVMQITITPTDPTFGLAYTTNLTPYAVTSANCIVKMLVYKPVISNVTFALKYSDNSNTELTVQNTTINQWEILTFNFSQSIGKTVIELAAFPDNNNRTSTVTSYFDNITFNDISTLPIQLISFKGSSNGFSNTLNWKTAQEINFNHFDIEKSIDGQSFEKIGEVKGGKSEYSYVDYKIGFDGYQYYRLKMVDNDGTFSFSGTEAIKSIANSEMNLSFYPNPAKNQVYINSKYLNGGLLEIYNSNGQILMTNNSTSNQISLDISNLPNGIFFVKVSNQKESVVKKLIKQ